MINSELKLTHEINTLRRSPKIGRIYELYREQCQYSIKESTQERQRKAWLSHLHVLDNTRADKITPLEFQELVLKQMFNEQKYTSVIYLSRLIVQVLDFAVVIGVINSNPLSKLFSLPLIKRSSKLLKENLQHKKTLDYLNLNAELKKLITDFDKKANSLQNTLLEISLRTLLRPSEVVSLNKNDISLQDRWIAVKNTKTKREFLVPLTQSFLDVLIDAFVNFGNNDSGYIFAGKRDKQSHLSSQTLNKALKDKGAGIHAHGCRSIGANFFARHVKKVHPCIAAACLQHVSKYSSSVESAYRRDDYLYERRKAMELWNSFLDKIYTPIKAKRA